MEERKSWDEYFIEEAARVASRSKDPSKKVGAIIVRPDRTEASRGYNGFPAGVADTPERLANKEFKSLVIMHAEENAIRSARGEDLTGCTLYVTPYMPCAHCASWIIASGIKRVVTDMASVPAKWSKSFDITEEIFTEAGVQLDFVGKTPEAEIVVGPNVKYTGQPHFIMIDQEGDDAALCQLIFEDTRDNSHFKVLSGDLDAGTYLIKNRVGVRKADGRTFVDRGNQMLSRELGKYTIIWRGSMPDASYEQVHRVAKAYQDKFL